MFYIPVGFRIPHWHALRLFFGEVGARNMTQVNTETIIHASLGNYMALPEA
jgi:hypothetical protein